VGNGALHFHRYDAKDMATRSAVGRRDAASTTIIAANVARVLGALSRAN